jgi:hypothetical protein
MMPSCRTRLSHIISPGLSSDDLSTARRNERKTQAFFFDLRQEVFNTAIAVIEARLLPDHIPSALASRYPGIFEDLLKEYYKRQGEGYDQAELRARISAAAAMTSPPTSDDQIAAVQECVHRLLRIHSTARSKVTMCERAFEDGLPLFNAADTLGLWPRTPGIWRRAVNFLTIAEMESAERAVRRWVRLTDVRACPEFAGLVEDWESAIRTAQDILGGETMAGAKSAHAQGQQLRERVQKNTCDEI